MNAYVINMHRMPKEFQVAIMCPEIVKVVKRLSMLVVDSREHAKSVE
jgi:hypothetical protein